MEIFKTLNTLGINKQEFINFFEKDSKLFLFKSTHFKIIFSSLKKYDIKSQEVFNIITKYFYLIGFKNKMSFNLRDNGI